MTTVNDKIRPSNTLCNTVSTDNIMHYNTYLVINTYSFDDIDVVRLLYGCTVSFDSEIYNISSRVNLVC